MPCLGRVGGVLVALMAATTEGARGWQAPVSERRVAGDARAAATIERMMTRLGGREVWARAQSLYVEYDGWRTRPNEPVIERAWRSFRGPYQRSEYQGRSFHITYALTPEDSWTRRNDQLTVAAAEHHRTVVERYPYGFYTSLHAFAIADPRIRVDWREPDVVVVRTVADGRERGWWVIDSTGAPIRWGAPRPDTGSVEYLYGPVRRFGTVNFPAWGTSIDGWWRWDYTRVDASPEPFTAPIARPREGR